MDRALEGIADHDRDVLSVVMDHVARKRDEIFARPHVSRKAFGDLAELERIRVRQDGKDTRRGPRRLRVDRPDPAPGDGALDEDRVREHILRELRRVARLARHLEPSVDPVDGLSDDLHLSLDHGIPPTTARARRTALFPSSILKPLCFWALASRKARSAAAPYAASSSFAPMSDFSASRARHGFVATPPSATRA